MILVHQPTAFTGRVSVPATGRHRTGAGLDTMALLRLRCVCFAASAEPGGEGGVQELDACSVCLDGEPHFQALREAL